jgi:hypothetical protein
MKSYITVVIEYSPGDVAPPIAANLPCMGGHIVAVQFNNALADDEVQDDE